MLTTIIQTIVHVFELVIGIPMLFLLLTALGVFKKENQKVQRLAISCKILVAIFLCYCFMKHFVFTPVNYPRFSDKWYLPLIRSLFYT
ncbi:hypothetical protein CE91St62_39150 [Lachnospiraceae bacterium]|uniref:hypothetical protein n=1 Tax=Extibacter sp. GGCC_0201 TaxID=2731209 RepID=UPI001AA1B1AF|nr:hypothetical protein [Extibacter sp. GGCC_0201]MBO1720722.1 hypothetical protein [Extibacter sp. GGCC_0201]BDF35853.1 hypothetical protein CE91St61_39280 [Lachnospiraceae bacterium]BDF39854.1 hypothetical protein CE91St62_39150 [Lachnospiraceae bacterium]